MLMAGDSYGYAELGVPVRRSASRPGSSASSKATESLVVIAVARSGSQGVGGHRPLRPPEGLAAAKSRVVIRQGTAPGTPSRSLVTCRMAGGVEVGSDGNMPPRGGEAGDRGDLGGGGGAHGAHQSCGVGQRRVPGHDVRGGGQDRRVLGDEHPSSGSGWSRPTARVEFARRHGAGHPWWDTPTVRIDAERRKSTSQVVAVDARLTPRRSWRRSRTAADQTATLQEREHHPGERSAVVQCVRIAGYEEPAVEPVTLRDLEDPAHDRLRALGQRFRRLERRDRRLLSRRLDRHLGKTGDGRPGDGDRGVRLMRCSRSTTGIRGPAL